MRYCVIGVSLATYSSSVAPSTSIVAPCHEKMACLPPGSVTGVPFGSSAPKISAVPSVRVTLTLVPILTSTLNSSSLFR